MKLAIPYHLQFTEVAGAPHCECGPRHRLHPLRTGSCRQSLALLDHRTFRVCSESTDSEHHRCTISCTNVPQAPRLSSVEGEWSRGATHRVRLARGGG